MEQQQNLEGIIGPGARYSEHKAGETIRFRVQQDGQIKQGEILYVRAPGPTHEGGREHSIVYIVDTGDGFPVMVAPGEVVAGNEENQPG